MELQEHIVEWLQQLQNSGRGDLEIAQTEDGEFTALWEDDEPVTIIGTVNSLLQEKCNE